GGLVSRDILNKRFFFSYLGCTETFHDIISGHSKNIIDCATRVY
ncbi:unnamed protein product, partial [Rotaria socialis]